MIEPTETESREAIEGLAAALISIADEVETAPEMLHGAPWSSPIGRLDEAEAARRPVLRWQPHDDISEGSESI
jgi:glycine dehydrogenase subunit 2